MMRNPRIRTHRWRTRKHRRNTDHLLHVSQSIRRQSRRRRTWRWPLQAEKSTLLQQVEKLVRTPSTGSIQPEHKTKDYLQFWQTRSHARIVCSSVPADCIYKAISQKGERILFERLSTSRPAPKIVLKSAWQSQQQQQQQQDTLLRAPGNWCKKRNKVHLTDNPELPCVGNLMRSTESPVEKEESEFKVDFRIEGIRCDPGRWTDNGATSKRSGKLRTGFRTKSIIEDLEKPEKSIKFSEESSRTITNLAILRCTNWNRYPEPSSAILAWSTYQRDESSAPAAFVFDLMRNKNKESKPDSRLW